ncbi:MAG: beta-ketoacyl-ACP synthase II [Candidatus Latescibacteria bacterium]|nr:beta-ketoacyl-ACP synthase II [Candidatus Latescibacterota bacterium]
MMRRVVVTGMGVISPVGNSVDEFWSSLKAGKSGIARVTKFDPSELKTQIAGEVKNFNPEGILDSKDIRRIDLFSQYGVCAAHEAIKSSGLSLEDEDPFDIGVIVGSGIGGINVLETQLEVFRNKGPKRVSPFYITGMITDIVAGHIAGKFGLNGPNYVTVSACASGAHAIGSAYHTIARGDAEVIVTGGAEGAVSAPSFAGFINIQALSRRNDEPEKASRPFNIDRDGFIMSEGSGMMILEELEHARRRGAEIIAEVAGVGFTADAHHITAPHPEGVGAARAMTKAIERSGKTPEDVDYINCHCPSTPAGDVAEVKAIKLAFGEKAYDLTLSSTKSMTGHLLGAAGAVEFIATMLAIRDGIVPPTINYENPDPECDLDCTPNTAIEKPVDFAISNSFGFGGHNVTLAVKKYTGD